MFGQLRCFLTIDQGCLARQLHSNECQPHPSCFEKEALLTWSDDPYEAAQNGVWLLLLAIILHRLVSYNRPVQISKKYDNHVTRPQRLLHGQLLRRCV